MFYVSTRGGGEPITSTKAVLNGIAPDGGLYMPRGVGAFDWKALLDLSTQEMSEKILSWFLPDFPDMAGIVHRAYHGKFDTEELTPVVPVGDKYVLELFHGPTSAFKDVALSVLPQLITSARGVENVREEIVILTATSGDTGKVALEGFHDVPGTSIIVFYPDGGVSAVQKAQMVTQEGANVRVCAVRGNFDDAQTGVKEIFAAASADPAVTGDGAMLSSANSINIGRLAPQVVYYFKAYAELCKNGVIRVGDLVDYTVPTGNFGDILAGYLAKTMGLPVGTLICASNANRVLTDFLRTGRYDRMRPFYKTESPSMDILVSSNLERLLYLASGEDTALVSDLMAQLREKGSYDIPETLLKTLQKDFWAGCADDAMTDRTIGDVWKTHNYLCDTHTAVAWNVAEQYAKEVGSDRPNVVLSTASAYKFPAAVVRALGETPDENEFAVMEQLRKMTGTEIPKNLADIGSRTVRHRDVEDKTAMLEYVQNAIKERMQKE
ncbi:MAG: threonine synthase [Oscillospiraceae bacterium]|nr:threonine synthase [Oscillospiraceae bacterium]